VVNHTTTDAIACAWKLSILIAARFLTTWRERHSPEMLVRLTGLTKWSRSVYLVLAVIVAGSQPIAF
jgi:hypothetical protein